MTSIVESDVISGVKIAQLAVYRDDRGHFAETFRKSWFPERSFEAMQTNRSFSRAGVLRGLHFHHRQIDYWYLVSGWITVGLADLRRSSPTRHATLTLELKPEVEHRGVFIPAGVAHGFAAHEDSVLTYLVDNYHDGTDEHGVAWDDPDLGIDWGLAAPIISERDSSNPRLSELAEASLPE